MTAKTILRIVVVGLMFIGNSALSEKRNKSIGLRALPVANVDWKPLNPARGKKSPLAANLWGKRTGEGPAGFLVKFVNGFSSPPHIHNFEYRGVVIRGLIHNDDPSAEEHWMPTGSFWTQEAGGVHITAARGKESFAYIEVDDGPFLVMPKEKKFVGSNPSVNLHRRNLVWLSSLDTSWIRHMGKPNAVSAIEMAFLWGDLKGNKPRGVLIKVPAGVSLDLIWKGQQAHVVVVEGKLNLQKGAKLLPGSYFGGSRPMKVRLYSDSNKSAVLYLRTNGSLSILER